MDVTPLERLRDELIRREWKAELRQTARGTVLRVRHPSQPSMNDEIVCDGEAFRWAWGQGIGPVAEVGGVADRIQYVLREIGA
jgi:hypothetical protein